MYYSCEIALLIVCKGRGTVNAFSLCTSTCTVVFVCVLSNYGIAVGCFCVWSVSCLGILPALTVSFLVFALFVCDSI